MGISGLCRDMCSRKSVKRCSLLFLQSYIFNLVSRCFAIGKARYHALQLRKDIYAFSLAKQSSRLQCLPEANSQAPVRGHLFG